MKCKSVLLNSTTFESKSGDTSLTAAPHTSKGPCLVAYDSIVLQTYLIAKRSLGDIVLPRENLRKEGAGAMQYI